MRKVLFITSSRADYGLLRSVILETQKLNKETYLLVTGSHLSYEFGNTVKEINKDNIKKTIKRVILDKKFRENKINNYLAESIKITNEVIKKKKPDVIIILGDRYELLGCAIAAMILRVPITHIHGGELTSGAYDDSIRHSITKLSHLHFPIHDQYKKRLTQLGENPRTIFNFGALTAENIQTINLYNKIEIEKKLNIKFKKNNFLVAIHPVSSLKNTYNVVRSTLLALQKLKDTFLIFTSPNSDAHSNVIESAIKKFVNKHNNSVYFKSLGYKNFLSCVKASDALIGNSSSGLVEAPILNTPSINIGDRQDGRPIMPSVICCLPNNSLIIRLLLSYQL